MPVQATPRQQQESRNNQWSDISNLPPSWTPIDTVLNTTRIPGTNLEIGTAARAVETGSDGPKKTWKNIMKENS